MEFFNHGINTHSNQVMLSNAFNMPAPVQGEIENLVFSGGGTKGVAYVGVLRVLDKMGITGQIKRYAGASAGAITAALLAIGMTTDEIEKNLPTSFMQFLDPEKGTADDVIKELERIGKALTGSIDFWDIIKILWNSELILKPEEEHMGLFQGNAFLKWLKDCFVLKKFSGDITFKELYDKTGKELHLMLCDSNYGKTLIANYINTPDMPVTLAVRCSMAIPFFFYPIKYNGDYFVDGGTMYNYPVEVFDSVTKPECTLGFILSTASSILWPERSDDNSFIQHAGRVIGAIMNVSYEYCFREGNASRTIFVDPSDVSSINFNLTPAQITALKNNGESATNNFFRNSYGPNGDKPIERELAFPIIIPAGKKLSMRFYFGTTSTNNTSAVVVNGDLFDGNSTILHKEIGASAESDWQWQNTDKKNAILFVTGWSNENDWSQSDGSIRAKNTIGFDCGFNVEYTIG